MEQRLWLPRGGAVTASGRDGLLGKWPHRLERLESVGAGEGWGPGPRTKGARGPGPQGIGAAGPQDLDGGRGCQALAVLTPSPPTRSVQGARPPAGTPAHTPDPPLGLELVRIRQQVN